MISEIKDPINGISPIESDKKVKSATKSDKPIVTPIAHAMPPRKLLAIIFFLEAVTLS
jgi:hypothetical protein